MPSSSPAFRFETFTRSKSLVASCRSATNALRGMAAVSRCTGCMTFHKMRDVGSKTGRCCLMGNNGFEFVSKND